MTSEPTPADPSNPFATTGGIANLASVRGQQGEELPIDLFEGQPNTWDRRLISKLAKYSDWLSPILVKEARQAMKSQQFTLTFYLLIVLGWIWTISGSSLMLPGIYYAPWGTSLLIGYLYMLAIPMMLVVPFFAFRSLASETEDGTFELMSITTLSAWQIVWGKMTTALLQILVYFSALAPCIAFTYLLRGVDIFTIGITLGYSLFTSVLLCAFSLMMATISTSRIWQSLLSVVLVIVLLVAGMTYCFFMTMILFEGNGIPYRDPEFWVGNAYYVAFSVALSALFLLIATSQISFASDNRSTRIRIALTVLQWLICSSFAQIFFTAVEVNTFAANSNVAFEIMSVMLIVSALYWGIVGPFLSLETATLSPRARRELPQSLVGRVTFTWFNPGDGSGLIFTAVNMLAVIAFSFSLMIYRFPPSITSLYPISIVFPSFNSADATAYIETCAGTLGYLLCFSGFTRLVAYFFYNRTGTRLPTVVGVVVQYLLYGLATLMPLIIAAAQSSMNNTYVEYSLLQAPNWMWTMVRVLENKFDGVVFLVLFAGLAIFVLNFFGASMQALDVRLPPPKRLIEEDLAAHAQGKHRNPWTV
ncbi:MAG: ABC transporter permease [Planctomycetaceae bacterium]